MRQSQFDFSRIDYAPALPLFPSLAAYTSMGHPKTFEDPFLNELASTKTVQRLKGIGFLGAIDYAVDGNGSEYHRRRHNRFEHSASVAQLAVDYARYLELSPHEERVLSAAGLLHDIGHGPLSHTLEPVFRDVFEIHHHKAGYEVLLQSGSEFTDIFASYKVNLDEVLEMIEGQHTGPHSYLFSSPINLDTIEGITRSRAFAVKHEAVSPTYRIVRKLARRDEPSTAILDRFWSLKQEVYSQFIHSNQGLLLDGIAQAFMLENLNQFERDDFFKTEAQLREKVPDLFKLLAEATLYPHMLAGIISDKMKNVVVCCPNRRFWVERNVDLSSPEQLKNRYKSSKTPRSITIEDLLERHREAV